MKMLPSKMREDKVARGFEEMIETDYTYVQFETSVGLPRGDVEQEVGHISHSSGENSGLDINLKTITIALAFKVM